MVRLKNKRFIRHRVVSVMIIILGIHVASVRFLSAAQKEETFCEQSSWCHNEPVLWAAVPYIKFVCKGYDDKKRQCGLLSSLVGDDLRLADIFLLSKLALDKKVSIDSDGPLGAERPPGATDTFGSYSDDLAVTLLAPMKLKLCGDEREKGIRLRTMKRYTISEKRGVDCVLGIEMPVVARERHLSYSLQDGKLYIHGFAGSAVTDRSTPLTQFFSEFASIDDFFNRAVLQPKGLTFDPLQCEVGLGNSIGTVMFEFSDSMPCIDTIQLGFQLLFPASRKRRHIRLWEVGLGEDTYRVGGFVSCLFASCSRFFNPTITLAAHVACTRTRYERFSRIRSSKETAVRITSSSLLDLVVPIEQLNNYYVQPFYERDSSTDLFADQRVCVDIQDGSRVLFRCDNEAILSYSRLNMFYEFSYEAPYRIKGICEEGQSCKQSSLVSTAKESYVHRVGWGYSFALHGETTFKLGTTHVISGKNSGQEHEFFCAWSHVF
ncbi:MAG: hypothetical protein WBQ73_01280 [Candidatus Babeliales bacterium]